VKRFFAAAAALLLVSSGAAQETSPGSEIILFGGDSVQHWRAANDPTFPAGSWDVRDGCLVARPGRIGRDLFSRAEFRDFDLRLEWKIAPGGNSGVKYLVDESLPNRYRTQLYGLLFVWLVISVIVLFLLRGNRRLMAVAGGLAALVALGGAQQIREYVRYSSTGLEMQLLDNTAHRNGRDPLKRAGALYGLYAPAEDTTNPAGEWNSGRIVVRGTAVEHWINGRRVVSYSLESGDFQSRIRDSALHGVPGFGATRPGRIVLQHHRDEVWFRDIRLKRLPEQ
jgi:hypothetical protein